MDFLRMAGDILGKGYTGVDAALGGVLPGGKEADVVGLGTEIGKDLFPGKRSKGFQALAKKGSSSAEDYTKGDALGANARLKGAEYGGKVREHVAEETAEMLGRKAAKRMGGKVGLYAVPVVGQGIAMYDGVRDTMDIADTVLQATSGQGMGQHVDQTIAMRNAGRGLAGFDGGYDPGYVGDPMQVHTVTQINAPNPIVQEATNRATMFKKNFNPVQGDFGVSEVMGWNR